MEAMNKHSFDELKNEMEDCVFKELEKQLAESHNVKVCRCGECLSDMACLALNRLKPCYRVSLLGTMHAKAQLDEETEEISRVIDQVIKTIAANPSHTT